MNGNVLNTQEKRSFLIKKLDPQPQEKPMISSTYIKSDMHSGISNTQKIGNLY
jgi:hypothetical protein